MQNLLRIPEFNILSDGEDENFIWYVVEMAEPPFICTQCGSIDGKFTKHSINERVIADLTSYSKKVRIILKHKISPSHILYFL
jgi:hypothetical protein